MPAIMIVTTVSPLKKNRHLPLPQDEDDAPGRTAWLI